MNPDPDRGSDGGAHPIDRLQREHAVILSALEAAESERLGIESGGPVRLEFWRTYLEFLDTYAERWHRGKEEQLLFPAMEHHGVPKHSGATAPMRRDHARIRANRARLIEALTSDDRQLINHLVETGIEDLRLHIEKEDKVVYQIARHHLDAASVVALARSFDDYEQRIGDDVRQRGEALAGSLAAGTREQVRP